jgi:hypothetical protein
VGLYLNSYISTEFYLCAGTVFFFGLQYVPLYLRERQQQEDRENCTTKTLLAKFQVYKDDRIKKMAEHVACTSKMRISYKVLIVKPKEKIQLDAARIG